MVETTLKTLIERFRSKPEWQHPDAAVRVEAVLRLPASEYETLVAIAREDADPRVRRAAVRKVGDVAVLSGIVSADGDAGVRDEAEDRLAHAALHEQDAALAASAVAGLRDARRLAQVAISAASAAVREAAVRALGDARSLASVVRECEDTPTRLLALGRIDDTQTLLALALKTEIKAVAVAAVERISDAASLEAVAGKARVGAAARRARAKLSPAAQVEAAPSTPLPLPAFDDEAERRAYEEARAALEREATQRAEGLEARTRLAEALEAALGEEIPAALAQARTRQAALPALAAAEVEALDARIAAALAAAEARHAAYLAGLAKRDEIEALAREAEEVAALPDAELRPRFAALEARWREASGASLPEPAARYESAAQRVRARLDSQRAEQSQKDQQHLAHMTKLADHAEALADKGIEAELRDAEHVLRDIREALDHPGHFASRRERELVVARLEAVRKRLYPLVQQLREDAEWKRWANVNVQEELCARAEALVAEPDVERASREMRELEVRWKQAKEAPKDKAEALWTRFRTAREQVKTHADAFVAKQAEEFTENQRRKEALCEKAEALAESSDWLKTAEELRALQAEWKAIGPAPRAVSQRLWERFRKPCDRFFTRWQEHRNQRSEEWAGNLERKEALCEKAEVLAESSDWEAASAELKRLQAEWRTIGAVKKSRSEAVWQRFRAACDRFFDRYKNRDEHARQAAQAARGAICTELEALLPGEAQPAAEAPADLAARVAAAQTAWRQAGSLPHDEMAAFDQRFTSARDAVIQSFPAAFEGTDLDPEASRRKAEKLASRAEPILEELVPTTPAPQPQSGADLAARLKDALASNTIGGRAAVEDKWNAAANEIETAQAAWKRLGPIPGRRGARSPSASIGPAAASPSSGRRASGRRTTPRARAAIATVVIAGTVVTAAGGRDPTAAGRASTARVPVLVPAGPDVEAERACGAASGWRRCVSRGARREDRSSGADPARTRAACGSSSSPATARWPTSRATRRSRATCSTSPGTPTRRSGCTRIRRRGRWPSSRPAGCRGAACCLSPWP